MELFAIHCTTCKARLKVTDDSVIGQILSCPKCSSMVMIEAPTEWQNAAASSVVIVPESVLPAATSDSVVTATRKVPSNTPPPLPAPPPLPLASVKTPPALPSIQAVEAMVNTKASTRDLWLLSGAVAAGIAISVTLWLLMTMRGSAGESVAATSDKTEVSQLPETESTIVESPLETAVPPSETLDSATEVETRKPVIEERVEPTEEEATEAGPAEEETAEPSGGNLAPHVEPESSAEVPVPEAGDPKPTDPEPAPEPVSEVPATGPLPDELLGKLSRRVPRVAFNKVPLRQFAAFVAEYADVKITIDTESLKAAGVPSPLVSVKGSELFLDKLLQTELNKSGLSFEPREGAIVIFAPK